MTGSEGTQAHEARFDLLIKGGIVLDPHAGVHEPLDVAIQAGQIAEVAAHIPVGAARQTIDAAGTHVVPGLIDLHTHIYPGVTYWGIDPEPVAAQSGVTTWVDAGSAGAFTLQGFVDLVVDRVRPQVFAYLNISCLGLVGHDYELSNLDFCDVELFRRSVERHPDLIVGVKARIGTPTIGSNGLEPLRRARQAAEQTALPMMVHVAVAPPSIDDVLELMRPGDVLTHCCTGQTMRILDSRGRLNKTAAAAREAGVVMDVGHGAGSFSFDTAEQLAAQGFWPDVISSDLHQFSQYGDGAVFDGDGPIVRISGTPSFDLPSCMSKFLGLGMPLAEVVRAATETPARLLKRAGTIGTLKPGAVADVALLTINRTPYVAHDTHGRTRRFNNRISTALTLFRGTPLASSPRPQPPVWILPENHAADRQREG
jgi:dihydroorotase